MNMVTKQEARELLGAQTAIDPAPGPLRHCQVCGSDRLDLVIDLGHQPLCDSLLTNLERPEMSYPLALWLCEESGLAQLDWVVDGREVYPATYPYRSGISKPLAEYQRAFAERLIAKLPTGLPNPLVVDVGSNDGTLLTGFKARGWRALGVEPTDVAHIAENENGVRTWQRFFDEECARDIVENYGQPRVVTMTNVFAHMAGLGEVMRALLVLLGEGSVFVTESHYLLDVFDRLQFDTIYHEHVRTYSLKSLVLLAERFGLEVFDVERGDRYGGNIRAYVARRGERPVAGAVGELLALEEGAGIATAAAWAGWRGRVEENKHRTMEFLHRERSRGARILGCSAPGRASTLINYYGIKPDLIPYTGELPNSLKLGKYLPGSHLPVVSNSCLAEEDPEYVFLFAWHYADYIRARLRREGVRSKLIVPLPALTIWED